MSMNPSNVAKQYQKADVIVSNGGGLIIESKFQNKIKLLKQLIWLVFITIKDGTSSGNEHFGTKQILRPA